MNQCVFITGASSGIGRSTALVFARQGARLFLVARRADRLKQVAEECLESGASGAETGVYDLSVPDAGRLAVEDALEQLGRLDILVLNAGYGCFVPVVEYSAKRMARMWQVNVQSAYESLQAALPRLMEQGRGHVVLVSSILGKKGIPNSAPYCATKFALVGLGQSIWGELREHGVGVSVVCPGYTKTEFHEVAAVESGKEEVGRPMKAQGADSVAKAIVRAVRRNRLEVYLTWQAKLILMVDRISSRLANRIMLAAGKANR